MRKYEGTCAGCGASLVNAREIGTSSIYNPNGPDFELCMSCYWAEESLTENETNFQPTLLDRYYATFGEKRPKLYDVLKDQYV